MPLLITGAALYYLHNQVGGLFSRSPYYEKRKRKILRKIFALRFLLSWSLYRYSRTNSGVQILFARVTSGGEDSTIIMLCQK